MLVQKPNALLESWAARQALAIKSQPPRLVEFLNPILHNAAWAYCRLACHVQPPAVLLVKIDLSAMTG